MKITLRHGIDGTVHPWWTARTGDDREFIRKVASLPRQYANNNPWSPIFRPLNLAMWRYTVRSLRFDTEHYNFMLDLVEADANVWVHLAP